MSSKRRDNEEDYSSDDEEEAENVEYEREVNIRELDLAKIWPKHDKDFRGGGRYILVGSPGKGKSTVIKSILYHKKHILPVGEIFSGTEESNGFFAEFVPNLFITNGLDSKDLTAIENFEKRQKFSHKFLEPNHMNPWAFLVIDDCTYDPKFLKREVMQRLHKNGRHWRMLYLLSLQYAMDANVQLRTTISGVFLFRDAVESSLKKLYLNFGINVNFQEFKELMSALTNDYSCLFIDFTVQSDNIEDCYFYYKADIDEIPKGWKIGCSDYWKFHEERYDPKSENSLGMK
jgi:hypothetical protein